MWLVYVLRVPALSHTLEIAALNFMHLLTCYVSHILPFLFWRSCLGQLATALTFKTIRCRSGRPAVEMPACFWLALRGDLRWPCVGGLNGGFLVKGVQWWSAVFRWLRNFRVLVFVGLAAVSVWLFGCDLTMLDVCMVLLSLLCCGGVVRFMSDGSCGDC